MTAVAGHKPPGGMHGHPPLTPAAVLLRYRYTVPLIASAFVLLAIGARYDGGSILLNWDEPITEWLRNRHDASLNRVVHFFSSFGSLEVVVVGTGLLIVPVFLRCRSLALVLVAATLARPALEWTLKELVGRERPDISRLVPGNGPSFPSGHVMAAIALWGLVPPIVALLTHRRSWWWFSVVLSSVVVLCVAFARVYLGVHWFSDAIGGLLLGSLYLLAVEWLLDRHHERRPCDAFVLHGHDLDEDLAASRRQVGAGRSKMPSGIDVE